MTSCACPASSLTAVQFAHGVVMQRCRSHELATWTVDGRRADTRTVRGLLKDLFVETRCQRRTPSPRALPVAVPAQATAAVDVLDGLAADDLLTALLNARGVQGRWATA